MNTTSNMQSHGRGSEEVDIKELMYDLWASRWLLLTCAFLFLGMGVLYSMRLVPQYQASVLFQVDSKQPSFGLLGGAINSLFGNDGVFYEATQIALIQSHFVLEPVIDILNLDIKSQYKKAHFWQRFFPQKKHAYKMDISVLEVPHDLINKPLDCIIDKPNHVRLMYQHKLLTEGYIGKKLSGAITIKINTVEAPVGSLFVVKKLSKASVVQSLLSGLKIDETATKMRQSTGVLAATLKGDNPLKLIAILNQIAETAQVKDAEKKAQEAAQTLSFLNYQLPITKKELEEAELRLNRYRAKSGKIDLKLQAQFLLQQLADISKKEGELRIGRIQMAQQYTKAHPEMQAMDAQFAALEREEKRLRKELKTLPASDQLAVNLTRDVKVRQALYKVLLQKIQELQVLKAGTVSSLRILTKAKLPDAPLPSKKPVICLASAMLGVLFACMMVFLRKLFWPKINDPHWVERRFNLPNLAIVPYCDETTHSKSSRAISLVAYAHPKNLAVESLRSLRTSIQVMLACSSNNVISILGLSPGVGKSFISANLAYLLAAGGKRVLVIDTDLRRGTLHKYFDVPSTPGLSDALGGKHAFESIVHPSPMHENLRVLPRGAYPSDPSELLMGPNLKAFVSQVSKAYDVVLFDSAPILLVTDALVVAEHSSLNYLVVAAEKHEPSEVELALKKLANAGVTVQGTVFNFHSKVRKTSYAYYYYGQYYKHAYYYHHDEPNSVKTPS